MTNCMKSQLFFCTASLILVAGCVEKAAETTPAPSNDAEIGASLTEKSDVDIANVPAAVIDAAKAVRPDVTFTEAEKEVRGGVTYFDIGGMDGAGNEIELDIIQDEGSWRVVEVQRDIDWAQTPQAVKGALVGKAPDDAPARIIESDQTDGIIVYEFYYVAEDGSESKHEVTFDGADAEYLTQEWAH